MQGRKGKRPYAEVGKSIVNIEFLVQAFAAVVDRERFAKNKALRLASAFFTMMLFDNTYCVSGL